jgi:hypothetical protein
VCKPMRDNLETCEPCEEACEGSSRTSRTRALETARDMLGAASSLKRQPRKERLQFENQSWLGRSRCALRTFTSEGGGARCCEEIARSSRLVFSFFYVFFGLV